MYDKYTVPITSDTKILPSHHVSNIGQKHSIYSAPDEYVK